MINKLLELFSKHGLVLALDDLQWISESENKMWSDFYSFMKQEQANENESVGGFQLLILSTYEENSITNLGSRRIPFDHCISKDCQHEIIPVENLEFDDVLRITNYALQVKEASRMEYVLKTGDLYINTTSSEIEIDPKLEEFKQKLANYVYSTTGGNPMQIKQVFQTIIYRGINNDHALMAHRVAKDKVLYIQDHFDDLNVYPATVTDRFTTICEQYLDKSQIEILKYAACICEGEYFSFRDLICSSGYDQELVFSTVSTCMAIEILIPSSVTKTCCSTSLCFNLTIISTETVYLR
ncbi:unnamed protein product [Ambrosiozyma monospora]|uniref:Unnamed protein product n=1 Tax=Ambrosiozyma monospora TaxID=43982 RepID=A0ACB5TN14_AMBMO|nr:unnamed protein product [Ambrosiozyma monospora]